MVEDSVRHYSSFLPVIYAELFQQSRRVISEGANQAMKVTRMRARPKILLCRTFEEAEAALLAHEENVLGVISDIELPRAGGSTGRGPVSRRPGPGPAGRHPDHPAIGPFREPGHGRLRRRRVPAQGLAVLLTDLRRLLLRDFASETSSSGCPTDQGGEGHRPARPGVQAPRGARREHRLPCLSERLLALAQRAHRLRAGP